MYVQGGFECQQKDLAVVKWLYTKVEKYQETVYIFHPWLFKKILTKFKKFGLYHWTIRQFDRQIWIHSNKQEGSPY